MKYFKRCIVLMVCVCCGSAYGLNDPMKPPFFDGSSSKKAKSVVARTLNLSMVLNSGARKVAIVNGKSVHVGDAVDGYRVLRIDSDRVVVSRKGKVREVYLGKPQQRNKTKVGNRVTVVED